jgi:elongation factor Ts
MQVAGLRPIYPTIESIPAAELEAKREHLLADEGVKQKPEHIRGQIVEGQLKKWFAEVVLTEQPFRDEERTVGELITEVIAKTGENIRVRRFVRFELGEEL